MEQVHLAGWEKKLWVYALTHTALKHSSCLCFCTHQNRVLPPWRRGRRGQEAMCSQTHHRKEVVKNICFVAGKKSSSLLPPLFFHLHPDTDPLVTQLLHGYPCQITAPWPRDQISRHRICATGRATYRRRQTPCWIPITERGCGHTHLSQVVEVILVVHPLVVGGHAVRPVGDVPDVNSQAVVELALEELQEGSDPISPFPHRAPHTPWDAQKLPRRWVGCRTASQVEHDRLGGPPTRRGAQAQTLIRSQGHPCKPTRGFSASSIVPGQQ